MHNEDDQLAQGDHQRAPNECPDSTVSGTGSSDAPWIESGGRKAGCDKKHEQFGAEWPLISVEDILPNPYSAIQSGKCPDTLLGVQKWLTKNKKLADKWDLVMRSCLLVAKQNKPMRIQCTFGKHRSVVVADALGQKLGWHVVHRDLTKQRRKRLRGNTSDS